MHYREICIIRKYFSFWYMYSLRQASLERLYDFAFRALIVFLPFYTFFTVFFHEKLGIPGISFLKEIFLFLMFFIVLFFHASGRKRIIWTKYDVLIGVYIIVMGIVTLFTTGIPGLIYGGRYDFAFLLAFFTIFHGIGFLDRPISFYVKLFVVSWGVMLIISTLLKWPLSEDLLLYAGYCGNPSNWQSCGWIPPVFHGIDGANVRRFQGILDGPNTMAAYLIIYIGLFLYYFRNKKDWYFVLGTVTLLLSALLFYTYSRSSVVGLFAWVWFIILFSLRYIFTHYRIQAITLTLVFFLVLGTLFIQYAGTLPAILGRGWSTQGHAERMHIGIARFLSHPLGQWLASAGPAYRYIIPFDTKTPAEKENLDKQYIPESWYIQQLIEWGIFGFITFITLLWALLLWVYRRYIIIAGAFVGILTMNLFLHTFESSLVSLTIFLVLWLLLAPSTRTHERK